MQGIFPLTLFILALRAELVVKLLILGISFLTSFTLALRVVLVAKLSSSYQVILTLYTSFLTTSLFLPSFSFLKSTGTGTNLSTL